MKFLPNAITVSPLSTKSIYIQIHLVAYSASLFNWRISIRHIFYSPLQLISELKEMPQLTFFLKILLLHLFFVCLFFLFTDLSTMSSISATGRRWWRETQTSRSMTTSGTTWWCPGMPTTYTRSRSTHAPLLSTPTEPATWTSKVTAVVSDRQEENIAVTRSVWPCDVARSWPRTHASPHLSKLSLLLGSQWPLEWVYCTVINAAWKYSSLKVQYV